MASGVFTDYRVEKWLVDLQSLWISLHYDDPSTAGAYASEVFGGSYTRVRANFSDPIGRVIFNETDVLFRGLPTVKITHVGAWDAQYNGNLEFSVPLPKAVSVMAGKSFQLSSEQLGISLP